MDRLDSSLCTQGCGFFGSANYEGMCSKCFKDKLKNKAAQQNDQHNSNPVVSTLAGPTMPSPAPAHAPEVPATVPATGDIPIPQVEGISDLVDCSAAGLGASPGLAGSPGLSGSSPGETGKSPAKGRNRCFSCNKKVGLTGFRCRCDNLFCSMHRYSDQHECSFDYKTDGRAKLERDNPQVVGAKIRKI